MSTPRPKRGLPPAEALSRWSDPTLYAEMMAFADAREDRSVSINVSPTPYMLRHREYKRRREALEQSFLERLRDRTLIASAFAERASARDIINPSLWDLLWIDYDWDEIVGDGRTYKHPEFFEQGEIPQNIAWIPAWLEAEAAKAGSNVFRHERDYRHVVLHGEEFALSDLQAKIVKILHEAFLADDPWQHGKKVLEKAGSRQHKIGEAFRSRKDWKKLIELEGTGRCRLRMDRPLEMP